MIFYCFDYNKERNVLRYSLCFQIMAEDADVQKAFNCPAGEKA